MVAMTMIYHHYCQRTHRPVDIRESIGVAVIASGVAVVLGTELLSAFEVVDHRMVTLFWTILTISGCSIIAWRPQIVCALRLTMPAFTFYERIILYIAIFYLVVLAGLAYHQPPNSFDALIYHLSRVAHWIQNHTVDFYPTSILRQLWPNPFASYVQLHLLLLAQHDGALNFIQYGSMIVSALGVSLILKEQGISRLGQMMGMLLCITLPLGILQATITLNDYVLTMWVVLFVYFLFKWDREGQGRHLCYAATALGLGCLTKNTMYIFALPFIIMVMVPLLARARWFRVMRLSVVLLGGMVVLNINHFVRNFFYGGHILTPGDEPNTLLNQVFSWEAFVSNVIRSVSLQFASTGIKGVDYAILDATAWLHGWIGWHVNDPRISYIPFENAAYGMKWLPFHEVYAGNPLHMIIFALALIVMIIKWPDVKNMAIKRFAGGVVLAWVLFIYLIKWQIWQTRLLLPLSVLTVVIIIYVFFRLVLLRPRFIFFFILLFSITAMPYLVINNMRPLIGKRTVGQIPRWQSYFTHMPQKVSPFFHVFNKIGNSSCQNVGLKIGWDSWEYPWQVFLKKHKKAVRIEHINVENRSQHLPYPLGAFSPCEVISEFDFGDTWEIDGVLFTKTMSKPKDYFLYELADRSD